MRQNRLQALELANEQHAKVTAWRDRRAANTLLVLGLAQHLDSLVKLGLGQHRVAPVVERVTGSQVHGQMTPTSRYLQAIAQPSHCHAVRPQSAPHMRT